MVQTVSFLHATTAALHVAILSDAAAFMPKQCEAAHFRFALAVRAAYEPRDRWSEPDMDRAVKLALFLAHDPHRTLTKDDAVRYVIWANTQRPQPVVFEKTF